MEDQSELPIPDPIYREETPNPNDVEEEQIEFTLPDDLQPGEDLWRQKEPQWSKNFEIDKAISNLNDDVRAHINYNHNQLLDLVEARDNRQAERMKVRLDTNALLVKDETDKINLTIAGMERRFTSLDQNATTLSTNLVEVTSTLEAMKNSMLTQNESITAAMGNLAAMFQTATTGKPQSTPEANRSEADEDSNDPIIKGLGSKVRRSRGGYQGSPTNSDQELPVQDRRGSLYETMGTPGPRTTTRASNVGLGSRDESSIIHYLREPDKDDTFKMKGLSVDSAVRLVDHRQKIYRETGFVRPMINYISIEVQEDLIANGGFTESEARKLRFGGLAKYSDQDMLSLIQQAICNMYIHAPSDFIRHLRSQKFPTLPEDYKAATSNFRTMSTAIGRYSIQFATRYDFLVSKSSISCIPSLFKARNVTDCVVGVFLEIIPYGLGKRINNKIPPDQLKDCDDLHKYLSLFKTIVGSMQRDSLASLNLYETLKDPKTETQTPKSTSQTQYTKKLMHTQLYEDEDEDAEAAEIQKGIYALAQPYNREGGFKSRLKPGDSKLSSDKERPPGGCLNHVLGDCPLGVDCRYAHAPEERMEKTWQYYVAKLGKSRYATNPKEAMELMFPKSAATPSTSQNTHVGDASETRDDRKMPRSTACELLSEDTDLSQDLLAALGPGRSVSSRVHKKGIIKLATGDILSLNRVLFDSGALHSSYISKQIVDINRIELSPFLVANPGVVRLGDNKTLVDVKENLVIPISFIQEGKEISAEVSFIVWNMPGLDAIIGLPDIIKSFCDAFVSMIKSDGADISKLHVLDGQDQLISPWTIEPDDEAPEELDTDLPCSFSGPLHYLSMSREEAIKEYKEQMSAHVEKTFAESTAVLELLHSDLALDVFVPSVWNGIVGVPDLELDFKDTLPTNMRPRARPVNPRLYDNAHTEFNRLCTYFYTPADSAIASPLVIAPKATKPFIRFCGDYVEVNKHITIPHYPIPKVVHALEKAAGFKVFLDIDMTNSFHQIKLGTRTSNILSVQTPWGLVRPLYMPEGIGPASGILQRTVMEIFDDYQDFMINIFDNLLVLCHDYDDALKKLRIVLERASARKVVLKF